VGGEGSAPRARRFSIALGISFQTVLEDSPGLEASGPGAGYALALRVPVRRLEIELRAAGFPHRLEPGWTDRSYGVHVAQLAGLPAAVVRRAREVLGTLEGEHRMVPGPQPAPPDPEQLDLLGHAAIPHPLLERLRELDLDSLTPIQAIVRLAEMQKEARG
jgi:hypothetical protein